MIRAFALLALAAPLAASDLLVTPADSIQAAIATALDGDRILVQPGTYPEQIDFLGKTISVIGLSGPSVTTIDAQSSAPVVRFAGGEGTGSRLVGFTITGGASSSSTGGILAAAGATPTIEDCIVTGNAGRWGGGISGSPVLRRCVIHGNTSSLTHGGGIYGAPQMTHCVVANNTCTSASGGGMYATGPTTIEDCLFLGNSAVFANSDGGGLYVKGGVTLRRCVISGNRATGGAFPGAGGGVFVGGSGVLLESCTITGNTLTGSSTFGGGVWGAGTLVNTIVRGNTEPQLSGALSVTYSNVEAGFAGLGNFDLDPMFAAQSEGDLHLRPGSPCIDLGDPALLDLDGSRSDVGAFPFGALYDRSNSSPADWDAPSWPEISAVIGGRQTLRILGGATNAGQGFLTAGSLAGTAPGTVWQGIALPLNDDRYFKFTVKSPNKRWLSGSAGTLDGQGFAETTWTLKPGQKAPLGKTTLHHAAMVFPASGPGATLVTGPVELKIVP